MEADCILSSGHGDSYLIIGFSWGESTDGFLSHKFSNAKLWCFFVVSLNRLLDKEPGCRWSEMPWGLCGVL